MAAGAVDGQRSTLLGSARGSPKTALARLPLLLSLIASLYMFGAVVQIYGPLERARAILTAISANSTTSAAPAPQLTSPDDPAPVPQGRNNSDVAVCMLGRNEHCFLREWILHHASIGVGKFYVFDTQSEPPMEPLLDDMIASGLVQYAYVTNTTKWLNIKPAPPGRGINWQTTIIMHCLKKLGPRHRWMAFIDADEFIVLEKGVKTVQQLLKPYEKKYGGLVLHWRAFSFTGHVERPLAGVLASYTACAPPNHRKGFVVKSIVQPNRTRSWQTVHTFNYREPYHAVNTAGVHMDAPNGFKPDAPSYKGAALHHYFSRSLTDFNIKIKRHGGAGLPRSLDDFLGYYKACNDTCTQAVPLGQQLFAKYDMYRKVPAYCLTQ